MRRTGRAPRRRTDRSLLRGLTCQPRARPSSIGRNGAFGVRGRRRLAIAGQRAAMRARSSIVSAPAARIPRRRGSACAVRPGRVAQYAVGFDDREIQHRKTGRMREEHRLAEFPTEPFRHRSVRRRERIVAATASPSLPAAARELPPSSWSALPSVSNVSIDARQLDARIPRARDAGERGRRLRVHEAAMHRPDPPAPSTSFGEVNEDSP